MVVEKSNHGTLIERKQAFCLLLNLHDADIRARHRYERRPTSLHGIYPRPLVQDSLESFFPSPWIADAPGSFILVIYFDGGIFPSWKNSFSPLLGGYHFQPCRGIITVFLDGGLTCQVIDGNNPRHLFG